MNSTLQDIITKAYTDHIEATEKLTIEQFEDAIKQAIACGDFMRHIVDEGITYEQCGKGSMTVKQAVTYLPYRRVLELELEIDELEDIIESQNSYPW